MGVVMCIIILRRDAGKMGKLMFSDANSRHEVREIMVNTFVCRTMHKSHEQV